MISVPASSPSIWSTRPSASSPSSPDRFPPYFGAALLGNQVVLAGGCDGSLDRSLRNYDTETGAIRILGAEEPNEGHGLPEGSRLAQVIEHQGQLLLLGGVDGSGEPVTRVLVYDPQQRWYERWYTSDEMPRPPPHRGLLDIRDGIFYTMAADHAVMRGTLR